jgi:hypothetical protein
MTSFGEEATRDDHLQACKDRALEYLPSDPNQAIASMISDMRKHRETAPIMEGPFAMVGMLEGQRGPEAARRWIEGFN